MGLPTDLATTAEELGISPSKLMGACGNAWPVDTVAALIKRIAVSMQWGQ